MLRPLNEDDEDEATQFRRLLRQTKTERIFLRLFRRCRDELREGGPKRVAAKCLQQFCAVPVCCPAGGDSL